MNYITKLTKEFQSMKKRIISAFLAAVLVVNMAGASEKNKNPLPLMGSEFDGHMFVMPWEREPLCNTHGSVESERALFAPQHTPTLDDDFKDDRVIVVARHSLSNIEHSAEYARTSRELEGQTLDKDFDRRELERRVRFLNESLRVMQERAGEKVFEGDIFTAVENLMFASPEDVQNNREVFDDINYRNILSLTLAEPGKENVLKVIELLQKYDFYLFAEPCYNYTLKSDLYIEPIDDAKSLSSVNSANNTRNSGGDPLFNLQWGLPRIQAEQAWNYNTGSNRIVRVGIMESTLNVTHEDIRANMLPGNFTPAAGDHGTMVAGIIGAVHNNGMGIKGVAQNVRMLPLNGLWGSFVSSLTWARSNNIEVINVSGGFPCGCCEKRPGPPSAAHEQAILSFPGLLVGTAGNDGRDNDDAANKYYPGAYNHLPNVISVGATAHNSDRRANHNDWLPFGGSLGSNFGATSVDLFAPGTQIVSSIQTSGYAYGVGTSFAVPFVSGTAALIWSKFPNATREEVKWAILSGVDRINGNDGVGLNGLAITRGRLNALGALQQMQNSVGMGHGVYYIRPFAESSFIGIQPTNPNGQPLMSYPRNRITDNALWVVHRQGATGNTFRVQSYNPVNGAIGHLRRQTLNNTNDAIISTAVTNLTITKNADGTFVIRDGTFALSIVRVNGIPTTERWVPFVANALDQKWVFEPHQLSYRIGDVNMDGRITSADVTQAQQVMNNFATSSAIRRFLADANRDGAVTQADINLIQSWAS